MSKQFRNVLSRRSVVTCVTWALGCGSVVVEGCGSVYDTDSSLSIHKRKCHSSPVHMDDAVSVSVVQTDVSSLNSDSVLVSTVDSTTGNVRRSVRINNKQKTVDVSETEIQ